MAVFSIGLPLGVHGVTKSWTQLSDFTFTFHFHALEKEMATHSSILAWRIPRDGGAWWAAIYGVAQSRTQLKRLSSSSSSRVPASLRQSSRAFPKPLNAPPALPRSLPPWWLRAGLLCPAPSVLYTQGDKRSCRPTDSSSLYRGSETVQA